MTGQNLAIGELLVAVDVAEGGHTDHKFVKEAPKRPKVRLESVLFALEELRWCILQRAKKCSPGTVLALKPVQGGVR